MSMFRPAKQKEEPKPKSNPDDKPKEEAKPQEKKQEAVIHGGGAPHVSDPEARQSTRTLLKVQPEREDLISLGGVVSPNNAGVQIVAGVAGQKVKVYDAGYHAGVAGLHYFYFGTSTTATTRRFLTCNSNVCVHKSFVQPRIGNTGDGLYLFSSVSETNMPYDVGYVQE